MDDEQEDPSVGQIIDLSGVLDSNGNEMEPVHGVITTVNVTLIRD